MLRKLWWFLLMLPSLAMAQVNGTFANLNSKTSNAVVNALNQSGADICAKIAAGIAGLPSTGGVVDLSGLASISPASCASNPFAANNAAGSPKPVVLKIGPGVINAAAAWVVSTNDVYIEGAGNWITTIHYTGSSNLTNPDGGAGGIVQFYVTPGGARNLQNVGLKNIHVSAGTGSGSHVSYAVLISQVIHGEFDNIGAWGATQAGIQVIGDAVANTYNRPKVSFQELAPGDDSTVPLNGISFMGTSDSNQVTESSIQNPIVEGVGIAQIGYTSAAGLATTTSGSGTGATISIISTHSGQILGYSFVGGSGYAVGDTVIPTQVGSSGARFVVASVSGGAITTLQEEGCGILFLYAHGLTVRSGLIEQNLAFDACVGSYGDAALAVYHSQMIEFDGTDFEVTPTTILDYGQTSIIKNTSMTNVGIPQFGGQNTQVYGGQVGGINVLSIAQNVTFDSVMLPTSLGNIADLGTNTRYVRPWAVSAIGNPNNNPFPWSYKENTFTGYNAAFGLQSNAKSDIKGAWFFPASTAVTITNDSVSAATPWHMILRGEWQDNNNFGAVMNAATIELSQTNNTYTTTDGVTISFATTGGKLVGTNLSGSNSAQFVGTMEFVPSNGSAASTAAVYTKDSANFGSYSNPLGQVISSTTVDYYWTAAGCATGTGQPVNCSATTALPGAMPDANWQFFCTTDSGPTQVSDFSCSPHLPSPLPTAAGSTLSYHVVQTMQNGGGGGTPTVYFHAHHN